MKFVAIVAVATLALMNIGEAKKYKVCITGTIDSYGYEAETNGAFVDFDEFEIEFILDDSAVYTIIEWGQNREDSFPNAINNFQFNLTDNAQGTYPGGASDDEDLYLRNTNSSPLVAVLDTDIGSFPPINGIPFIEMSVENILFGPIILSNLTNGKTLSEINNNVDLKNNISWPDEGYIVLRFMDFENNPNPNINIYGTFSGNNVTVTDYVETPSIILNTYKSNDMQNWELIESKEIQSEDALFLKSELVTQ